MRRMVFWRRKPYDRSVTLEAADKARGRGRIRKAIAGYTLILKDNADDYQVHARIAPLLARRQRWTEARTSFNSAAAGFLKAGFAEKAIAVWTLAAQHFPEETEFPERIANEQVKRGRKADAVNALLDGRNRLRARRQRPIAILLLRQVLMLQPLHIEATLDLAKLLVKEDGRKEALKLLRDLRFHVSGRNLRRLRASQFWIEPGWRSALDWALGR
jgi:hypothetical protein